MTDLPAFGMPTPSVVGRGSRLVHRTLSNDTLLLFSLLFYIVLLHFTYLLMRATDRWLYFTQYFSFNPVGLLYSIPISLLIVLPILFVLLKRSMWDPFALILAPLALLGGASGTIILCCANLELAATFVGFYLVVPFALLFLQPPTFEYPRIRFGRRGGGLLILVGLAGAAIYAYLAIKYFSLLSFPGLGEVYVVRARFESAAEGWERYAVIFAKFVSTFSLLAYAIARRSFQPFLPLIFIFGLDYMLGGHKLSLAYIMASLAIYAVVVPLRQKYQPYLLVLPLALLLFTVCVWLLVDGPQLPYFVLVYDRIFNVSGTLFAMYVDYANTVHFFGGGDGLLGQLFGGINESYYVAVGELNFGKGVSANADLISDAYINFGPIGVLASLIILRLCFSVRDARFFASSREAIGAFLLPYAIALFSMGLQTAMITGGLAVALLILKLAALPVLEPSREQAPNLTTG